MEIKELKEKLEKGVKIYYAPFWIKSASGSLVSGATYLFFLTTDSKPKFSLTIDENKKLGLVNEIEKDRILLYYNESRTEESGGWSSYRAEGIAFSDVPFVLWICYRGETGMRIDDRDEIEEAKEINSVEEFLNLIK